MSTVTTLLSDPASVGVWNLVPAQSSVGFTTKTMWGIVPVKGRFTEFSGDAQITDAQTVFGHVDIKVASLNTKMGKRDKDLRSAEFFDVETYPDINVVVTGAALVLTAFGRGNFGTVRGDMDVAERYLNLFFRI